MIILPPLKELVNNLANGVAYPVWVLETSNQQIIQQIIHALSLPHIELKLFDNPKVDEVREMLAVSSVQSLHGARRIFVLTNAQDINHYSANALLKTLEEPAKNCFFLLVTNNCARLLPTIVSRSCVLKLPNHASFEEVMQIAFDLYELWSQSLLVNEIELAEKWCKLYDTQAINFIWYCLSELLLIQALDNPADPLLKKISKLMPNKLLWAMFSKAQHALQLISSGITPNLQLLIEDLLIT